MNSYFRISNFWAFTLIIWGIFVGSSRLFADPALSKGNLTGTVIDSSNGRPLEGCVVGVYRQNRLVSNVIADQFGHFLVHNLQPGDYLVQTQLIGFRTESSSFTIDQSGTTVDVTFHLAATTLSSKSVTVTAEAPIAIDTRSGDQEFQQSSYHGAPTNTTSQILQQSIAGAVRAPTGEVHIRGQHAEYTYYVDGVPVPAGVSGSLNELFDPAVVNRIDFQTGGWDAEYGGKNAAVINVLTRIPTRHADASSYIGSFHTNGQTVNLSNTAGKWGWYISGNRQETAMRQEPVLVDTTNNKPVNFHNHGHDYSGFGKLQYIPSGIDVLNLTANLSETAFQVPYDSTGGALLDDHQKDLNSFVNLSWRHLLGANTEREKRGSDLFAAVYYRHGKLEYLPGLTEEPSFIFYPDPATYNLNENRSFNTEGVKLDYHWRTSHEVEFKLGMTGSVTSGHESFVTTDTEGNHGPGVNSGLTGHDFGVYAQTTIAPQEWIEFRAGARFDSHNAPFAGNRNQLSPRVKLSLFPDLASTIYLYYGRLFLPTNVEDLRAITSVADSGIVTSPTLPERDNFFELGFIHRFPAGVVTKLTGYYKESTPGIDDNTVPGSAIITSVNLGKVKITGIEAVVEFKPSVHVDGYLNLAINHAYGRGPITGGFFPTDIADVPGVWFDLDHDQRISAVGSLTYHLRDIYLSGTGIYGSGLTNGAEIEQPIGTGLFDKNSDIHVDPNFILNASAGCSIPLGGLVLRPQLYVDNLFDKKYLLKGAFFSGASAGRPRSVQFRVNVGF